MVSFHGIAGIKDAMAKEILERFAQADIAVGPDPTPYQVVGVPPIRLESETQAVHPDGQ